MLGMIVEYGCIRERMLVIHRKRKLISQIKCVGYSFDFGHAVIWVPKLGSNILLFELEILLLKGINIPKKAIKTTLACYSHCRSNSRPCFSQAKPHLQPEAAVNASPSQFQSSIVYLSE
jgi:hypothetical protein